MMAGAPNRPLPPTPDEDANERTLIMKRVSGAFLLFFVLPRNGTGFIARVAGFLNSNLTLENALSFEFFHVLGLRF